MTYFQTKLRPEDFIVTEILSPDYIGEGDFHYILFEKKGLTTFLLLDLMITDFMLNKNMVGIAGLKDKHAITRQRLSISKRDVVKQCGGINKLLERLRKKGKVVNATYGKRMLKLGDNDGNKFDIKLIPVKAISDSLKADVSSILTDIAEKGVPNYFGEQRFGHGGTNRKIGYELLAGTMRNIKGDKNTLAEKRFKVQAFASYIFNVYIEERQKKGLLYKKIPGDVLAKDGKTITGPVPGDDLTEATQDAGKLESEVFAKIGLTDALSKNFKKFGLFGIRRPIVLYPHKLLHRWQHGNLFLSFELGSGAYATVIIDALESRLAGGTMKKPERKVEYVDNEKKKELRIEAKMGGKHDKKHGKDKDHKGKYDKYADKKPLDKKKDPTINPYTGQKINLDKKRERDAKKLAKEKKRAAAEKKPNPDKKKFIKR